MKNNKLWKLESNDKLSSKVAYSPMPSPVEFQPPILFTDSDKEDLQNFSISAFTAYANKSQQGRQQIEKEKGKVVKSPHREELQRRIREREEMRMSSGPTVKPLQRLQEELRNAERELSEKQVELMSANAELQQTHEQIKVKKRKNEDIANNQNMLKFKEDQLSNLKAIHAEIVEGFRKEIVKEKRLKQQNQVKFVDRKKNLDDLRVELARKENMIRYVQELAKEKKRLQKSLENLKQFQADKLATRSGAVKEIIEQIVRSSKEKLEAQCDQKIAIVRQSSTVVRTKEDLRTILANKGISSRNYYTYRQLQYVPELNFRKNKEAEKILSIFDNEIKISVPEAKVELQEPQQLSELKKQLIRLQDFIANCTTELKQKQIILDQYEKQHKEITNNASESKKKAEAK